MAVKSKRGLPPRRASHRPSNPHTGAAVALVQLGDLTPEQAAEELRKNGQDISSRTIRRALKNVGYVAPAAEQPSAPFQAAQAAQVVEGTPIERLRAYAAHDAEALAVLERMASKPAIVTTDLKESALRHLAQLEVDYHTAQPIRRGPLAKAILAAIQACRVYFPPAPTPKSRDEVLEELRRLDQETLAIIEQHAANPIEAQEIQ